MRQLILPRIASPIGFLAAHLQDALVNIAPENRIVFGDTFKAFTLEALDNHLWICHVDVANKYIQISREIRFEFIATASELYPRRISSRRLKATLVNFFKSNEADGRVLSHDRDLGIASYMA